MRIVGITAEYNPFHQGHARHLAEARRLSGADYVIVAMSGNYVQRGAPAMFDKYARAEAALAGGADLILELPPRVATGSAEYFASGAVRLLAGTGLVTDLCFGAECDDPDALARLARVLSEEPEKYRLCLKDALRRGRSYPEARAWALGQYDPALPLALLASPNNLLGVEYLKALFRQKCSLRVQVLKRAGASYHEPFLTPGTAASAGAIRGALIKSGGTFTAEIRAQLPFLQTFRDYEGKTPITEDAFSLLLLERLRRNPQETFDSFFGVTAELSNRIRNRLDDLTSFSRSVELLKTRNLTETAVRRALLHILLDIRTCRPPACFRVLGFRREAVSLLAGLKERGNLPLVTSASDDTLPEDWLFADRLYESVRSLLHGRPFRNERRRKMLVL